MPRPAAPSDGRWPAVITHTPPDGPFVLPARAWAVKGTVPQPGPRAELHDERRRRTSHTDFNKGDADAAADALAAILAAARVWMRPRA